MAIIGNTYPSLIDMHESGTSGQVIEILQQQNAILDDAIATECNMGSVHRHMVRTGLPSASWGKLYKGIIQSKATMQQVDDVTGFLEASSPIDVRMLRLANDESEARLVAAAPYLETMNDEMATGLFYHDTAVTPEKFKGLSARYNVIGGAGIGKQVVNGGGTGSDNTSIWFVTWGDHATTLLYPKGTQAGVMQEDRGEQRVLDKDGNHYYSKEVDYTWHIGLSVMDWRYNSRIANIDVSDMLAGSVDVWDLLRRGYYKLQSRRRDSEQSRIALYMNRDVLEVLDRQSSDRSLLAANSNFTGLSHMAVEGKEVLSYRGIPIREVDALLNTEAQVI